MRTTLAGLRRAFLIAAFSSIATSPAISQDVASRATPSTDGSLRLVAGNLVEGLSETNWRDPSVWGGAQVATDFIQSEPIEGNPASERTEVRVGYDEEAIYIGAWLYDSEPSQILVGEQRRDANLGRFDAFLVVLDTYADRENGFVFATNPGGIEHDGQVIDEGRNTGRGRGGSRGNQGRQQGGAQGGFNVNWDSSWAVSTERDDQGWYAFFRIPFSTLRYGTGSEWGINFARYIGRKNEQVSWAPLPRQDNLYRVSYAGTLEQLNVPVRRSITVTPYALSSAQKVPAVASNFDYPFESGADAKIGITPALSLDLTLNTDFAQVEVDNEQVDLTRFSLFFPEKRPFFLENAGRFAVGNNSSAQMFFSRRIGIGAGGAPVPINWGSRLSGRVGGLDVGMIHMRTGEVDGLAQGNGYTVARVARELPNRSGVGLMYTGRDATGISDDFGRTFAVDTNIGIGEFFNFTGVVGATENQQSGQAAITDQREAVILSGLYRDADWQFRATYDRIGANFNPEVGFLRRSDFQQMSGTVWRYIRVPSISWLRELQPHTSYTTSYGLQTGIKETATWHIHVVSALENGGRLGHATDWVYDGLSEPLSLTTGVDDQGNRTTVEVLPGEYSGILYNPTFSTSSQVPVVWSTTLILGRFFSGNRRGGNTTLSFQFGGALTGALGFEYNRIELPGPGGRFDATLLSSRIGYSFSPNLYLQSLIQYNTQTAVWSGNLRFGWVDTAGTGLFIVYNERQNDRLGGITTSLMERTVSLKFSRQLDIAEMGRGF
ncbi:MAG: carbohydrate binding family 9 domain-containing protein [Gemmatimonadetes bacterium]|nr:carbohydrate binding family 9 domain-containing protein [Gemmatimonadota bacterium]